MNQLTNLSTILFSVPQIISNLLAALIFGIIIALVYKKTHRGITYSQSFMTSLVLIVLITATVIMVIGNSLPLAFGLIGAFSVIRFRTPVKDVWDMTFLFLALTLGLASGSGIYPVAIMGLAIISATIFILQKLSFGVISANDLVLTFQIKNSGEDQQYQNTFKEFLKENILLNARTISEKEMELSFKVHLKNNRQLQEFIKQLGKVKGISKIEALNTNQDIEY